MSLSLETRNHKPNDSADELSPRTLIVKAACFGRLVHASIGYSGPLCRELLAFQFTINAVRTSLRDLFETILISMCLNGEVDRNRSDWSDLAFRYGCKPDYTSPPANV
jgi:Temperature dependent protein affecting M2 dsRNA replication